MLRLFVRDYTLVVAEWSISDGRGLTSCGSRRWSAPVRSAWKLTNTVLSLVGLVLVEAWDTEPPVNRRMQLREKRGF